MTGLAGWLDALAAAGQAEAAETAFRAEAARRIAALAEARAFAYRRLNLVRAIGAAIAGAEDADAAVAQGLAVLRDRLGWSQDSEVRSEIAERFASVCAAFEAWYLDRCGTPFWILFEVPIRETPLVDF